MERVPIRVDKKTLKRLDEVKEDRKLSRNWIINYLLKRWIKKDDCKITMDD